MKGIRSECLQSGESSQIYVEKLGRLALQLSRPLQKYTPLHWQNPVHANYTKTVGHCEYRVATHKKNLLHYSTETLVC